MNQSYDYIIIGGGTAGCPLAATLAQKGRVLLLERGPAKVQDPKIRTPCNKDEVTWHRTSGGSWTATGNVLGGGSSINAGVFLRERSDSPFFTEAHPFLDSKRVEHAYNEVTNKVAHRRVTKTKIVHDLASAMQDIGLGKEAIDTNTGRYGHFHPYSLFNEAGVRHTSADLLPRGTDPAAANLTVCTNIRVLRLLFDTSKTKPQAMGFEYHNLDEPNPTIRQFYQSDAHYFLSCGAIHTPRLLMLSGVGNADELLKLNIPVILNQPHVGQHLKDKSAVAVSVSSVLPVAETVLDTIGATPDFTIGTASGGSLLSYLCPAVLGVFPKTYRTASARQAVARIFQMIPFSLFKKLNQQITIYVTLSNPVSEGRVELSSADPQAQPVIHSAGYQAPEEVQAAAKGLDVVSRLIHSPTFSQYIRTMDGVKSTVYSIAEQLLPAGILSHYSQATKSHKMSGSPLTFPVMPKTDCKTLQDMQNMKLWLNDMHAEGWTYTGTCRFDDVVNRDFTVKGVDNLSIADASVLKRPPRVNGQATMMMIGMYAGNLVVENP